MAKTNEMDRRDFLRAGGASLMTLGAASQRVLGANDRVQVAICGLHGRGLDHLKNYAQLKNVQIAALCDIDDSVLRHALAQMERLGIAKPVTYTDVRKLLESKSIDAISIATPNHWHSLMAIWGCQAGKDVYVEKPCSHNLWEGQQLVKATRRYHRIVQHGTQSRSSQSMREAVAKMKEGAIGETYMARGICYKWRDTIGHAPVSQVPAGVDYDLWTGPAPLHAFTKNRFHYNWHWFWEYGNGDIGNQGIHQVDVARWGMGLGLPNKVSAIGGHFMFDDDQQTPNDLTCAFEFDLNGGHRRMITFEVRHWITNHEAGIGTRALGTNEPVQSAKAGPKNVSSQTTPRLGPEAGRHNTIGNIFYGANGYLASGDEDASTYRMCLGSDEEEQPAVHAEGDELAHFKNFIDCVVSRNPADLAAPIEEGHISCALVHLANASYRLGRTINFNPVTEQAIGDEEADRLLRDGDRGYRAPFVVPEDV